MTQKGAPGHKKSKAKLPTAIKKTRCHIRKRDGAVVEANNRPINDAEPAVDIALDPDSPPAVISADETACTAWREILNVVNTVPGWVTAADAALMLQYAISYSQYSSIFELVGKCKKKTERTSLERSLERAHRMLLSVLKELGLTPIARTKVVARAGKAKGKTTAEEFSEMLKDR